MEIAQPAKAGPGQMFVQELIDAKSGHAKRWRNVGTSPLSLAFYRGQLCGPGDQASHITAEDRHSAGQRFARLWEARYRGGVSLDTVGHSGDPYWWTERVANASQAVERIRARMYIKNFVIVQRFCGEGHTMAQALRGVVEAHPNGVVIRVREAMDDLVTAMTGRA
jgi:hypothetical protein